MRSHIRIDAKFAVQRSFAISFSNRVTIRRKFLIFFVVFCPIMTDIDIVDLTEGHRA